MMSPRRHVDPRVAHRAAWLALLSSVIAIAAAASASAVDRAEWRTFRHDNQNSRTSSGKGKLQSPVTRWRVRIGGRAAQLVAADATLNGRDDVIAIVAGAVSARRWDGSVLWKSPVIGALQVVGVADMTGDGVFEVAVRSARGVRVLSLVTGAELWQSPAGAFDRLKFAVMRDFDGDGLADLALANDGGFAEGVTGDTHVFSLAGKPKKLFSTAKEGPYGTPIHAANQTAMDADGDGDLDFVLFTAGKGGVGWLFALSGQTGTLIAKSKQVVGLVCSKRIGLPGSRVACVTPAKTSTAVPGLRVFKREGAAYVEVWSWLHPAPATGRVTWVAHRDLDNNGHAEILLFARELGFLALDTLTGKIIGAPFWHEKLGDVKATVVAETWTLGVPVLLVRSSGVDTQAPAPTHVLTWSVVGGVQHVSTLGVGVLSVPRVQPAQGLAPPSAGELGGGANVAWRVDSDGDGLVDTAQTKALTVKLGATPNQAGSVSFTTVGAMPHDGLGGRVTWARNGSGGALLLRTWEDVVAVRDAQGKLLNDVDTDGVPDLAYGGTLSPHVRIGWLGAKDAAPHILVGLPGRALVLNAAGADAIKPPQISELHRSGTDVMIALPLDGDGDGDREIVVAYRPAAQRIQVQSFTAEPAAAKVAWKSSWVWTAPDADLRFSSVEGPNFSIVSGTKGGAEDLLMGLRRVSKYTNGGWRLLDGKSGDPVWKATSAAVKDDGHANPTVILTTPSGPALLQSIYRTRLRYLLADGSRQGTFKNKEPRYGIPKLLDVDGDGAPEVVIAAAAVGIGVESATDHTSLWLQKGSAWRHAASAVFTVSGKARLASLMRGSSRVEVRDAKSGALVWSLVYGGGQATKDGDGTTTLGGLVAVMDLIGDGTPGLLFTSGAGRLYAVNANTGAVLWSRDYGGQVGMPYVADVDGDGLVEIVVSTPDGYLEALDTNTLGLIAWVRDNDGKGPALTDAADIDEQASIDVLHANWAKLAGASGYHVRVQTKAGAVVAPWRDVGNVTQASIHGLNLQLDRTYQVIVRGYGGPVGDAVFSTPVASDGVRLVDGSAPEISRLVVVPATLPAAHDGAVVELDASDDSRLADVTCAIAVDAGVPAPGPTVGTVKRKLTVASAALKLPWDGRPASGGARAQPGQYRVLCEVTDVAGNVVKAETKLRICQAAEVVDGDVCRAPGLGGPDAGGADAADVRLNGEQVDGCGCAVRGGRDQLPTGASVLLLLWCVATLLRRRCSGDVVQVTLFR